MERKDNEMSEVKSAKFTSRAYGRISHEKDRPKPEVSLAEREAEARALGLSFGMYMGYLESGYLETYKRMYKKQKLKEALSRESVNIIQSHIGSGGKAR